MCVAWNHGVIIVSWDHGEAHGGPQLRMYSLADGSFVRRIGSKGSGKGQFNFYRGGLCVSPDGDSVLVAEYGNGRVQQVRIVDGSWVRFVGKGVLSVPDFVDCNADVVVVSEAFRWNRISVFSWSDGSVRTQIGHRDSGPGRLIRPFGLRLLADGSGVVVADSLADRLCVFALSGELVSTVGSRGQGLDYPCDVAECALGGGFVVANTLGSSLVTLGRNGVKVGLCGEEDGLHYGFGGPVALAVLPDGGMVVREWEGNRLQIFRGFELRKTWIIACATLASRGWRTSVTTKRARVEAV
jgi:hypothetical protein